MTDLIKVLRRMSAREYLLYIGCIFSLLGSLLSLLIPTYVGLYIDGIRRGQGDDLTKYIILPVVLVVVQVILNSIGQYLLSKYGSLVFKNFQHIIFKHTILQPISHLEMYNDSEWSSHLTGDVLTVREFLSNNLPMFIQSFFQFIFLFFYIIYIDAYILIPIIVFTVILLILMIYIGDLMDRRAEKGQSLMAELMKSSSNMVSRIKIIKSYQIEDSIIEKNNIILNNIYENHMASARLSSLVLPLSNALIIICGLLVVVIGSIQVASEFISAGKFITVLIYIFQLVPCTLSIVSFWASLKETRGELSFLINHLKKNPESDLKLISERDKEDTSLELINFTVCLNDNPLFKPINLCLREGEVIGIKGESGIGKSSIFDVLETFNNKYEGIIKINSLNYESVSIKYIREQFALVKADNNLLQGDILHNLIYDSHLLLDKVRDNTNDVFIKWILDNLEQESNISDLSQTLSSGEQQKLSLLRALLSPAPILLLDEVFANMDNVSKKNMWDLIKLFPEKSILCISHSIDDLDRMDKILTIT